MDWVRCWCWVGVGSVGDAQNAYGELDGTDDVFVDRRKIAMCFSMPVKNGFIREASFATLTEQINYFLVIVELSPTPFYYILVEP